MTIPATYAGGAKSISDLVTVDRLSQGKVDLTYGRYTSPPEPVLVLAFKWVLTARDSSLDIFGGTLVKFEELVKYNNEASCS